MPRQSTSQILIDSGRSPRGASYYGTFMLCRQLFAYRERLVPLFERGEAGPNDERLQDFEIKKLVPASALTIGSMGHTGLAHWFARQGAVQAREGKLPDGRRVTVGTSDGDVECDNQDDFLEPHEAVRAWCEKNGRGHEFVEQVDQALDAYFDAYPEPPGLVTGVECLLTAVLGKMDGVWGLWIVLDDVHDPDTGLFDAFGERWVEPELIDAPGHPDHGKPILITRRADLIVLDPFRENRASIVDHKFKSDVSVDRSVRAFKADLGFGLFWEMGEQAFDEPAQLFGGHGFSGVYVNMVQKVAPHRIVRAKVPKAKERNRQLPRQVFDAAHEIARLDMETMAGERTYFEWGMAQAEAGHCEGRYGPCGGYALCFDS